MFTIKFRVLLFCCLRPVVVEVVAEVDKMLITHTRKREEQKDAREKSSRMRRRRSKRPICVIIKQVKGQKRRQVGGRGAKHQL